MTDIARQQAGARAFLKRAAEAQDANQPMKAADVIVEHGDELLAMQTFGMVLVDETEDTIAVTIDGRIFAGILKNDVEDFGPGKAAEVRGSIAEGELAARFLDGKVHGIEKAMLKDPSKRDEYLWLGRILKAAANELRQGFHLPERIIEGRVVPYNESNDTGVQHAANLALFFSDVHDRNCRAGWWNDLDTGEPKKRSVGELLMLFVTEIAEAYLAYEEGAADDKLPEYPGLGVEIGDLAIRMADFAGAAMAGKIVAYSGAANVGDQHFRDVLYIADSYEKVRKTPEAIGEPETGEPLPPMDIPAMIDAKLAFNANRKDHKVEERRKDGGKKT